MLTRGKAMIVELMTSGYTDEGIFPFLVQEHKKAGLHPVVARKESTGFIFNRIWAAIKREVLSVIMEGVADADTIDKIWQEQYSSPIGPCMLMGQYPLRCHPILSNTIDRQRGLGYGRAYRATLRQGT